MKLRAHPISLKRAAQFTREHHRHHDPAHGALWALGALLDDRLVAVAVVGRPVSRHLDNGLTAEITRLASDGTKNACSFLYSACTKACTALGYQKIITYILQSESGASLAALLQLGWSEVSNSAGGGSWSSPSRPRKDHHPLEPKKRYEVSFPAAEHCPVPVQTVSKITGKALSGRFALKSNQGHLVVVGALGQGRAVVSYFNATDSALLIACTQACRAMGYGSLAAPCIKDGAPLRRIGWKPTQEDLFGEEWRVELCQR